MKITYKEGDWFAVPIESGFVLGRIARARKSLLLGYFYKSIYKSLPDEADTRGLVASDAFYITRFGYLGFVSDNWPVIYRPAVWNREEWPVPPFGRLNDFSRGTGFLVFYDDKDIAHSSTQPVTAEEAMRHPKDGLAGHVFLQNVLERQLTVGYPPYEAREPKKGHFWFTGLPKEKF